MTDLADRIAGLETSTARQRRHRRVIAQRWPWDGKRPISQDARLVVSSITGVEELRISTLLTFDVGAHSSGWWRNSDYERCWHLSLVGIAQLGVHGGHEYVDVPLDDITAWASIEYGRARSLAWTEPPAGDFDVYRNAPASRHTTHIRLFVDQQNQPIKPTGEVYTLKPYADGSSPEKVFR